MNTRADSTPDSHATGGWKSQQQRRARRCRYSGHSHQQHWGNKRKRSSHQTIAGPMLECVSTVWSRLASDRDGQMTQGTALKSDVWVYGRHIASARRDTHYAREGTPPATRITNEAEVTTAHTPITARQETPIRGRQAAAQTELQALTQAPTPWTTPELRQAWDTFALPWSARVSTADSTAGSQPLCHSQCSTSELGQVTSPMFVCV